MNIAIVGLGLIGGSAAKALKGFKDAHVFGIDRDKETLKKAEADDVIEEGFTSANNILDKMDLTIICVYPEALTEFLNKNAQNFKQGSTVIDMTGVKECVMDAAVKSGITKRVNFIGGHPMAGREVGGYDNSLSTLYKGSGFLLVPDEKVSEDAINKVIEILEYMGFTSIKRTTAQQHDETIAFTSQILHVIAVALSKNDYYYADKAFKGGSFRDYTRIALINENLWSETLMENRKYLLKRIDEFEEEMRIIKQTLIDNDKPSLRNCLKNDRLLKED